MTYLSDIRSSKFCSDCRRHLPLSAFTRNKRMNDGLSFYCGACTSARTLASKRKRVGPPRTRSGQGPKNVPPGSKWCPQCGGIFVMDDFPRNRNQTNGRGAYCRKCHSINSRAVHLRSKYGLSVEDFERMLVEQSYVCAICLEAPAVQVDHDHATGEVRGLLCFNCNGALGQFRDRPELMTRAALYLTLGAGAVAATAHFEFAFTPAMGGSNRPDGEDNAYLFEYLDEVEAV